MSARMFQHHLSQVSTIEFDLSFYDEETYTKEQKKRPVLKTPTIEILPSGNNQIGKSTRISEFKIDVCAAEWVVVEDAHAANLTAASESTNTLSRFAHAKSKINHSAALVNLTQLGWLLRKHEKLTITSVTHSISSYCNVQPTFSPEMASFGILSNVSLHNIYITKNFVDNISRVDLVTLLLSGQIVESNCALVLTKNIRNLTLDCTVSDPAQRLVVFVPYGCRIDLLELYSSWVYNHKYGSVSNTYNLRFAGIPPESESMHTIVFRMMLDIHPADVGVLEKFMASFVNIVCNELILHCHADSLASDTFIPTPMVSYNARFLDAAERAPILHTTCTEKDCVPVYRILENMRLKQFQINALFFQLFFVQMKAMIPPVPVVMIECEYGWPCVLNIDIKTHKYLFLNTPNVTGTYQHHNVDSKNDGKYIPILDIPREFDVHRCCQVIFAFEKIPCGIMAHHPVIGTDLQKFSPPSWWGAIVSGVSSRLPSFGRT